MSDLQYPSDRIAAAAQAKETLLDSKGRRLTLRNLNVLDQARLLRAIGPAQASNEPYVNMVQQAAMVEAVDDVPLPFPTNERTIDACIARIGDEGFAALVVRFQQKVAEIMQAAESVAQQGEAASPLA